MDSIRSGVATIAHEVTKGRPYAFVIMSYNENWILFERIKAVVESTVGLACVRADNVQAAGHDLLAKIHLLIDRAEIVLAEISSSSPNVFYELGYAVGRGKSLLLVKDAGKGIPTDLRGLELIEYGNSKDAFELFDTRLREHLRVRVGADIALMRDMLEARVPRPNFIFANPKVRGPATRVVPDRRTFGDNLGVLGLISAFGSIHGEHSGVELVGAQSFSEELLGRPINLYFIGSPKNNPPVRDILRALQREREPAFEFGPAPGATADGDYENALFWTRAGVREDLRGEVRRLSADGAILESVDYGLIIRGPHPEHPGNLMAVMAGVHSLGTGAACLAATRSAKIREINTELVKASGLDVGRATEAGETIWVLVQGLNSPEDAHLDVEGVRIVQVGVFGRP